MTVSINAKIAGTGAKTSIGAWETSTGSSDELLLTYVPFSGAGTDKLVWIGPGRLMQVVVTTGAAGTIDLADSIANAVTTAIGGTLTTTTSPETFLINSGLGTDVYAGIVMDITGANTGYLVVKEME